MDFNVVNAIYEQTLFEERQRKAARAALDKARAEAGEPRRHYPSSACAMVNGKFEGKCRRATWFSWKDFEETDPPDAPALFKMRTGDLIHEQLSATLVNALVRAGFEQPEDAGAEQSFRWRAPGLKYEFSGRMDHVFMRDGKRYKAEWKSTYGRGADFIKRDGPKVEHLLQCSVYLEQDEIPTDGTVLLYAARDSGLIFGYQVSKDGPTGGLLLEHMNSSKVEVSPVKFQGLLEATMMLEEYLDGDEPPPKDFGPGCWQCDYCSYAKLCKGTK